MLESCFTGNPMIGVNVLVCINSDVTLRSGIVIGLMIKAALLSIFVIISIRLQAQPAMTPLICNGSITVNAGYPAFYARYGLGFSIGHQFASSSNGGFRDDGIFIRPVTYVQPYWDVGIAGVLVHSMMTNEIEAWEIELKQTSLVWNSFRTMDRNYRGVKLLQALGIAVGYGGAISSDVHKWIYASINMNQPPSFHYNRRWFGSRFRISLFARLNYFPGERKPIYMGHYQAGIRFDILWKPWITYSRFR